MIILDRNLKINLIKFLIFTLLVFFSILNYTYSITIYIQYLGRGIRMKSGTSHSDMRAYNRGLVLKHIATGQESSRIDIAKASGLTKTAITNVVTELMNNDIVCEQPTHLEQAGFGRPKVRLVISPKAPLVGGVLIRRGTIAAILGHISGEIVDCEVLNYTGPIDPDDVVNFLLKSFPILRQRHPSRLLAIGVSAPGLIDNQTGEILNPPDLFSRDCNLPIVPILQEHVHPIVYFMHDSTANALAEKLYAPPGALGDNFAFITLANGIGAGLYLNGSIYEGSIGKAGQLGHIPVTLDGRPCQCGGSGCLKQYSSLERMVEFIQERLPLLPNHPLLGTESPGFAQILALAEQGDPLCRMALKDYAHPLGIALTGLVNLLDLSTLIIHHEGEGNFLRNLLQEELNARIFNVHRPPIPVLPPRLGQKAPFVATLAIVSDQVFNGALPI